MESIFSSQQRGKHKVFVSFHNEDQFYRDEFDRLYGEHYISRSVDFGDIDPDNKDEYIKRLIQEDHISDASVIVALYGANTWRRKHVDWEISAGLMKKVGGHSGLVVLVLPSFIGLPNQDSSGQLDESSLHPFLHPRTSANIRSGFANVYYWPGLYPQLPSHPITGIFEDAFRRRVTHKEKIDNSAPQYDRNR